MAKKKKTAKIKNNAFQGTPFKHLKGFAFSPQEQGEDSPSESMSEPEVSRSFSAEMEMLGVQRLKHTDDSDGEECCPDFLPDSKESIADPEDQSDEALFLSALGEMSVSFQDQFPDDTTVRQAAPRRMKQLKLGKIVPEASLDLHGCKRIDVAEKISHFLSNSLHHGYLTVIIITGKGLHSEGGVAVLRDEAEQFLAAQCAGRVAEWGRAPKQYGGNGALAVFLRNQKR